MDLYGHSLQINIHDLAMQLDNIQSSPVWLYKYLVGIAPGTSVGRLSVCIISSSSKCLEHKRFRYLVLLGTNPGFVILTLDIHISHCSGYFNAQRNLVIFIKMQ